MDRPRQSPQHKQAFGSILIAILMETYTNKVPNKAYLYTLCKQKRVLHEDVKGMKQWIAQANHGNINKALALYNCYFNGDLH